MSDAVIVAILGFAGTLAGSLFGILTAQKLTQYRIARAQELLSSTMHTVKEVGAACGYSDTSYFIRVFKRLTGVTPTEYRCAAGQEKHKKIP